VVKDLSTEEKKIGLKKIDDEEDQIKKLLPKIYKELDKKYPGLKPVIVPCKRADTGSTVFIVSTEEVVQKKTEYIDGSEVLIQNPKVVDKEGINARNYEKENRLRPTINELKKAKHVLERWSEVLWNTHSNLSVITVGGVKSRKTGYERKTCIVLLCTSKGYIPIGEKAFPETLKTEDVVFDVDVREGCFEFGPRNYVTDHSSKLHRPLTMGCQISKDQRNTCGTMGPFVDLGDERIGFLTCAHVLFEIENPFLDYKHTEGPQQNVLQPALTSFEYRDNPPCGHVVKAVFKPNLDVSVDAAVVEITDRNCKPIEAHFALADKAKHNKIGLF